MANPKTVHLECDPSDQQKKSLRAKQRSAEILNRPRTNTSSQNREVASGNSKPREIGNQSKPLHDEQTLSDIVSDLTNENKNLRAQVQILRNHWQAEVEDLAKREEKRKSNELILRAEIQHLKDARRERERAGLGDMEEELYLKTHDTYRWQARVAEMQDMKLFVDGNSPRVRPIEEKIIQQALDSVAVELQILRAHDTSNSPPTSVALGQNSDLDLLLRSMIPEARDMAHRRTLAVSNMFKWGLSIFARGLAVAAIKDWVMDTDFPSFIGSGDPRILEEYRKILSNFDGWQRLHNLEMAAYRSLTETIYFKESFLPRAANDLADRLSMALVPLFVHTSDASLHEGFASWGEDEVTSKNRQLSLKRMFEAALRLKVATVLTDERYQFQLHPLGTVSKASISDGEYRNNPVARNDDMTKNWLHASLMVYRGEQSNPRDRMEDALVHPKNFFSTGEKRSRPPLATQRLTVRDGTCSQTSEGASSPAQRAQKDTLNEQQRKEEAHMPVTNSRPPKRSHNNTEILDNITSEPASKRQMLKGLEPSKSLEMSPQLQTSIVRNGVHDMDCEHEEVESSDGIPIRNSFPYTSCHAESGTERNLLKHQQEEHPELSHDRHTLNSLQSQSYSTPTITKLDNTAGEGHVDEKVTSRKSRGPNSPSTHCGGCDKSFASSYSLKQHQKNKICKGRKCKECDDVFWKLADLETHMHHEHAQSMLATPLLPSSEFQSRRSRPYNQTSIPLASPFSTAATETNAACPEQETFIAPTTNEMMNFPRTRFKSSYSFPVSEQDNMWGSNTMSGTVLGSQSSPEVMEPKPDRGDSHHGRDYNNKSASTDNGLSSAKRQDATNNLTNYLDYSTRQHPSFPIGLEVPASHGTSSQESYAQPLDASRAFSNQDLPWSWSQQGSFHTWDNSVPSSFDMRSELNLHEKHDTARSYALLPTTERHDSIDQAAELTSERPMHFSSQLFSSHEAKDTILNTLDLDYPFASSSKIPLYNLSQENDAPPTFQLNQEQPHLVNEKLQTESRRFVSPSLDTNSFYPSQESVLDLLAEASTVEILEMQGSHNNKGLEDKSSIHVKRTPSAMAPRPGQSKSSRNLRIRNSQLSQWPICVESESEFEDDTEIGIPHEKSDNFQGFDRPPNSTSASQPETQTSFSVAGEKYAETNAVRSTSANSPALHNTAEHTPASQSEKRRDFSAIPGSQTLLRFLPGGGGWVTEER